MTELTATLNRLKSLPVIAMLLARAQAIPATAWRKLILLLLILWLFNIIAAATWLFIPSPELKPLKALNSSSAISSGSQGQAIQQSWVDVSAMQAWYLFGNTEVTDLEVEEVSNEEVDLDVKETRLSLKLLGVIQSSKPSSGHAIIQYQSKSELYKVGENIPISRGVSLSKVLADRVIIDNRGNFESLYLWDEATQSVKRPVKNNTTNAKVNTQKQAKTVDYRNNAKLTSIAADYKRRLFSDPASLSEVLRFSPARNASGEQIGFRISPGRDREQFKAFGLKSGDIVQSVNGVPLNDPSNAMRLYQDMRDASDATFDILRGSENISISVSLDE